MPFERPHGAHNKSSLAEFNIVIHAIDTLAKTDLAFDIVVLLEPTSPLRNSFDIDEAVQRLIQTGAGAVVSVCRAVTHIPPLCLVWTKKVISRHILSFETRLDYAGRTSITIYFIGRNALYASHIDVLKTKRSFYHEDTVAFEDTEMEVVRNR